MYWLWFATALIFTQFLVLTAWFGSSIFFASKWDEEYEQLIVREVRSRGLPPENVEILKKQYGITGKDAGSKDEELDRQLWLHTLVEFGGEKGSTELLAEIRARRTSILSRCLTLQARLLRSPKLIESTPRVWKIGYALCYTYAAASGVIWIGNLALDALASIAKTYTTKLGIVAIFASQFYWLSRNSEQETDEGWTTLVSTLTKFVLPALCLFGMVILARRVLVRRFGPWRQWNKREVVRIATIMATMFILPALFIRYGGTLSQKASTWMQDVDTSEGTGGFRVGVIVMLAGIVWLIVKSWQEVSASDGAAVRAAMIARSCFLGILVPPLLTGAAFGQLKSWSLPISAVILCFALITFATQQMLVCFDAHTQLTILRSAGWNVPKRGYSKVASAVWVALTIALIALSIAGLPSPKNSTFAAAWFDWGVLIFAVGTYYVLIFGSLYVRRIRKTYQIYLRKTVGQETEPY